MQIARDIKENLCKIVINKHEAPSELTEYELPDGSMIKMGDARYNIPECIYKQLNINDFNNLQANTNPKDIAQDSLYYNLNPYNITNYNSKGLNKHVLEVINKCDMD